MLPPFPATYYLSLKKCPSFSSTRILNLWCEATFLINDRNRNPQAVAWPANDLSCKTFVWAYKTCVHGHFVCQSQPFIWRWINSLALLTVSFSTQHIGKILARITGLSYRRKQCFRFLQLTSGSLQWSSQVQLQSSHQRSVAPLCQWRDHQSGWVAEVLEPVLEAGGHHADLDL